jgi:putative NADPH-quinone reductase
MTTAAAPARVLVLDGHPDAASLCGALAEIAADTAQSRGAEVRRLHLSAMAFDPNLAGGYKTRQEHEPDLLVFLEALRWCDTLILVHPMWWGAAPAKLKGLIDRAFLPGIAFAYEGDGHFPRKLFEGRTARVLITTDTPSWYLWLGYRNGWLNVLRRQILDFVGLKVTHMKTLGPIRGATPAAIDTFKEAARKLAL